MIKLHTAITTTAYSGAALLRDVTRRPLGTPHTARTKCSHVFHSGWYGHSPMHASALNTRFRRSDGVGTPNTSMGASVIGAHFGASWVCRVMCTMDVWDVVTCTTLPPPTYKHGCTMCGTIADCAEYSTSPTRSGIMVCLWPCCAASGCTHILVRVSKYVSTMSSTLSKLGCRHRRVCSTCHNAAACTAALKGGARFREYGAMTGCDAANHAVKC